MENKLALRAVLVLAVCFTVHLTSGEASNKTTSGKLEGSRNEIVELGKPATLICTNEKIDWDKMIYVIWKINSQGKTCFISVAKNDTDHDTCTDGKKIEMNGSLIIPNINISDVGNYSCDVSYESGYNVEIIHVSELVHPNLTGWLENESGQTFAICEAKSKPAATIYWKTPWNTSVPQINSSKDKSGLFTVTSRLQLYKDAPLSNLTCLIPSSPNNLEETQHNTFDYKATSSAFSDEWPLILLGVCATCLIVILLTGLYIMREKIRQLSVFRKIYCTPQVPTPVKEEKMPQPRDPEEEVEPYASYVQRVNSIYNSSAELFNV